jgi:hypothetical protein
MSVSFPGATVIRLSVLVGSCSLDIPALVSK